MDKPRYPDEPQQPVSRATVPVQFIKSLFTAWAAFFLDWLVLEILIDLTGLVPSILKPASYITALIFTFLLSKYWIFKPRGRHATATESLLYVLGAVVSLGIAAMSIHTLSERYAVLDYRLANALGMALVFVWNFFYRRVVVFPASSAPSSAGAPAAGPVAGPVTEAVGGRITGRETAAGDTDLV
ncbi:GtrA family protein [Salinispira pacifica]|uniref:GtrA/DPMS transmembrane domain-containing protein n=1 Tax=Salinispira pacifica TaxID=1307761 RepID=V5WFE3_9SPIO|nr:GtrA family protein [Salinispira pacifica]AHC14365.1 hypothetical protein L21SP2_0945 [Salinispira pacifica]